MTLSLDQWYDWWRLILLVTCAVTAYILLARFRRHSDDWNPKTRDYWFALWIWNAAGFVATLEGVILDLGLGSRLVFVTAASLVSLIGLSRRGSWGGIDD